MRIAFMDGNPDRPFISGALSNPETGFTDHASNVLFSGIGTAGGVPFGAGAKNTRPMYVSSAAYLDVFCFLASQHF